MAFRITGKYVGKDGNGVELMGQGAFCDCEVLYNAATESRLKSQYWHLRAHETRG